MNIKNLILASTLAIAAPAHAALTHDMADIGVPNVMVDFEAYDGYATMGPEIGSSGLLFQDGYISEMLGQYREDGVNNDDDGIYLHQTVERSAGQFTRHVDLDRAFAALRRGESRGEWRVHCHVPVFLEDFEGLGSTQGALKEALALCREREVSPHLEIETYTWSVLPPALRDGDLAADIAREVQWVRSQLRA